MRGFGLVIIFLLVAFSITFFNPFYVRDITEGIRTIFSFVSFFFVVLSGFFIASLWERFTKIRSLMAKESASLENIYKFFEMADEKVAGRIAKIIDEYIIKVQDYDLHEYQKEVGEDYYRLYKEIDNLKQSGFAKDIKSVLLGIFNEFTITRKEILSRGKDKIGLFHWVLVFSLASLTVFIWLNIQFVGFFGVVVGTVLIFAIMSVITIIYDLNNLTWGIERMDVEIYEKVYDIMGISRYYPEECLKDVKIPDSIKEYRVGRIIDPKNMKRKIEIVKIK